MSSKAFSGVGTIFQKWDGSKWVRIAEITSIKGPGFKRDPIEVTNMDSTGGYKEYIAGFRDAGTISLSMNFTREGFDTLKADFESDEIMYYEIVFADPDKTSFEFRGMVTELPLTVGAKEAVSLDTTIQITGKVLVNSGQESGSPNIIS